MSKLQEEKLAILKNYEGKELTKAELINLGISAYYIKVFMDSDVISRVSKGVYKVSFKKNKELENNQKMFRLFHRFRYKVLDGKYVEAYHELMENYKLQDSHNYDNHMRIYFIFLRELIGSNYDFSPLNELYEFTDSKTDTYYDYFIDFREAVMQGDYYDAKMYLDKFAFEEKEKLGYLNISTTLFVNMLEDVLKKIENSYNNQANRDTFRDNYHNLVKAIIANDYDKSLEWVERCIYSSKTANTTLEMKRIRTILNDIISLQNGKIKIEATKLDYSKTTNLYSKLDWALKAKDYYMAHEILEAILENDTRGKYKTLKRLIDIVIRLNCENNVAIQKNMEKSGVSQEQMRKINSSLDSLAAYKMFSHEFQEGNYESALYYLEISILKNQDGIYKKNGKRTYNLLKELIDMEKSKRGFTIMDIDYSDCSNASELFNKALDSKDFKTAFKNIGKVTYKNESRTLSMFKEILHLMYDLDKKYGSNNNNNPKINKNKVVEDKISEDKAVEVVKGEEQPKVEEIKVEEVQVEEVQVEEQPKVQEKIKVTEELVESYVDDGRYDELFVLLKEKKHTESLNRLEHITYKLIKIYNSVVRGIYEVPDHEYLANEYDSLGRFFEAIRCEDVYTAYGEIACIYGKVSNQKEFDVFETILKDVIDKYETLKQENDLKITREEILSDINSAIERKTKLTDEDISKLYGYFTELGDIEYKETYEIMEDMVEFISLANNGEIDSSYLANLDESIVSLEGEVLPLEFSEKKDAMFYLRNGDYLSASQHIQSLDKNIDKTEREILKKLLYILSNALNKKKDYTVHYEEIPVRHLDNVKKLIEKYDFYGAFNYVLDNNLDDPIYYEIFPDIFGMMAFTLIMQEGMRQEFYDLIKAGNTIDAYADMVYYKEALDKTSLGSIESLQEKYKKMEKVYKRSRGE